MEIKQFSSVNELSKFKERQFLPDLVKCVAIINVVWGHAIQYWHGVDYDFWNDLFFKLIYGFHMPLFALISGYLFSFSMQKCPLGKMIVKKGRQLILPCISWGVLMAMLSILMDMLSGRRVTGLFIFKEIVSQCVYDFWFFKAIFISSVLSLFVENILKMKKTFYILLCVSTIFVPSIFNFQTMAFVFPYFVIGLLHGRKNKRLTISSKMFWITAVGYLLLIALWRKEYYIYISGMSILYTENIAKQMFVVGYRFLTGLLGSIWVIGILERMENKLKDKLRYKVQLIGSKTGVVYLLSTIVFLYSDKLLMRTNIKVVPCSASVNVLIDLLVLLPISIFLVLGCVNFKNRLFRNTTVNKFLFGIW